MISFYEAASELESICDKIDTLDTIDSKIQTIFKDAKLNLAEAVDKRISYIKYAEHQLKAAKEMREEWDKRVKRFDKMLESIKLQTMAVVKNNPNLPYRGSLGSFRVQRNSTPHMIIDESCLDRRFVKPKTVPDMELIKSEIKAGVAIIGVSVEYGEHLRVGIK